MIQYNILKYEKQFLKFLGNEQDHSLHSSDFVKKISLCVPTLNESNII